MIGEHTKVGKIFLNQDSSPRQPNTNLDYPLTYYKKIKHDEIGWKVFTIFLGENGFFAYNIEQTGKSLQLNSKGEFISQPDIKK